MSRREILADASLCLVKRTMWMVGFNVLRTDCPKPAAYSRKSRPIASVRSRRTRLRSVMGHLPCEGTMERPIVPRRTRGHCGISHNCECLVAPGLTPATSNWLSRVFGSAEIFGELASIDGGIDVIALIPGQRTSYAFQGAPFIEPDGRY